MKIAGKTWFDVASDVNWQDYGGVWARRAGPDAPGLWYALRYDPAEDGCGASCTIYEIRPAEVSDSALRSCDYPADGCDEYGDQLSPLTDALLRVQAAVWYGKGRVEQVSASTAGNGCAARLRATAARYAVGDLIPGHPFHWGHL